jgi:hypothetical protein
LIVNNLFIRMFSAENPLLRSKIFHYLKSFKWADHEALIVCLSFGFFVRLIPEVLAGSLPIGFDTVHYAVAM